jgi:hypothetical protein
MLQLEALKARIQGTPVSLTELGALADVGMIDKVRGAPLARVCNAGLPV